MVTGSARERALEKAREKLGITGPNPAYWSTDPDEIKLREELRYWYYHFIREEQEREARIAASNSKLEEFI